MILTIDVQYSDPTAIAAGVLFSNWEDENIHSKIVKEIDSVLPYEPGAFYKRELPCLLSVVNEVNVILEAIVVDGYVTLGQENKPGLGMYLYREINESIPVIGVAKKCFIHTPDECQLHRGKSDRPLFVTSIGMPLSRAKEHIANMHGKYRMPTLLTKVDQLCRGTIS